MLLAVEAVALGPGTQGMQNGLKSVQAHCRVWVKSQHYFSYFAFTASSSSSSVSVVSSESPAYLMAAPSSPWTFCFCWGSDMECGSAMAQGVYSLDYSV